MMNMSRYFLYLFCQLITDLKLAHQSQLYVNASSGLNRAVLVQGKVRLSYGYFTADNFSRLQVPADLSTPVHVISYKECALNCLKASACASFNVASLSDADGKIHCELLNEDKYNHLNQLTSSQNYHHFRIKVCHLYYLNNTDIRQARYTNIGKQKKLRTHVFLRYKHRLVTFSTLNFKHE